MRFSAVEKSALHLVLLTTAVRGLGGGGGVVRV